MHSILVKDIMTSPVTTVTPETFVMDAAVIMEENNIRRVPVVNADGQLRGMLTDADVVEAEVAGYSNNTYGREASSDWIRVSDVMSHNVITVEIDCTVSELAATFLKHKVGGVPVISSKNNSSETCHNELLGIVTETDIFKLVAEEKHTLQGTEIVASINRQEQVAA